MQSWDTANKPSELADYSVCTTWGLKGPSFYLLNVFRKKLSFPELKRAVAEQDQAFRPQVILIEDKASGTQLIQDLLAAGLSKVTRYAPDGDKIMRLHAQTATIENGFVWLPEQAHWLADYLSELAAFPMGRHDDQVEFDRPGARLAEAPLDDGDHRLLRGAIGRRLDLPAPPATDRPSAARLSDLRQRRIWADADRPWDASVEGNEQVRTGVDRERPRSLLALFRPPCRTWRRSASGSACRKIGSRENSVFRPRRCAIGSKDAGSPTRRPAIICASSTTRPRPLNARLHSPKRSKVVQGMSGRKILVTAFEPFGGETVNASWEAALALDGFRCGDAVAVARRLPCVYDACVAELIEAFALLRPAAVLMTGQAASRAVVSVERIARNSADAAAPDNRGVVRREIASDGPERLEATARAVDVARAIRAAGPPARVSTNAGDYVCNHLYYGALRYLRKRAPATPAVFVHLPATPAQTPPRASRRRLVTADAVRALEAAIAAIMRGGAERGRTIEPDEPASGLCLFRATS